MKKVLMIALPAPPLGSPGAIRRIYKFAKYLPDYGWEPIILTAATDKLPGKVIVSPNIPVYKTKFIGPTNFYNPSKKSQITASRKRKKILASTKKFFMIPDDFIGWVPFAVSEAIKIAKENKIDVVYSVSPEHSCHIIGKKVSKKLNIPWVADFKDPWTTNPFVKYLTPLHKYFNVLLEKKTMITADRILTVSEPIKKDFVSRYSKLKKKFTVITNSFDPDNLKGIRSLKKNRKIRIVHTGAFYGDRTPSLFIETLKLLDRAILDNMEVIFVGKSGLTDEIIDRNGLNGVVKATGQVTHQKSLEYQKSADILLLIPGPGKGTMTGKIFEYLAMNKKIFAIAPGNEAIPKVLEKTKTGITVKSNSPAKIAIEFKNMLKRKKQIKSNKNEINKYNCKYTTEELAKILDSVYKR